MNPIKEAIRQHNNDNKEQEDEEDDDDDIVNTLYYYILLPIDIDTQEVQQECLSYVDRVLGAHLWQEEAFTLYTAHEGPTIPPYRKPLSSKWAILHGKTSFGDNIEDEWLIVSLLFHISETYTDSVVFMEDDDGEFLAIEAAEEIPEWLHPENTTNKLAVHKGRMHIVPPPPPDRGTTPSQSKGSLNNNDDDAHLDIGKAVETIRNPDIATEASAGVQQAIGNRVSTDISQAAQSERHISFCTVPRTVAELLAHRPQLVAPAVNAFYTRDAIDIKACTKMQSFPLDSDPSAFVSLPVRFTKCTYAQLRQQRMHTPKVWQRYIPTEEEQKGTGRWLNGMKLTCGLEILLSRGPGYHLLQASKCANSESSRDSDSASEGLLAHHRKRFSSSMIRQHGESTNASVSKNQALEIFNRSFDTIVQEAVSSRAIDAESFKDYKGRAEELYLRLLDSSKVPNSMWLRIMQKYQIDYTLLTFDLMFPRTEFGLAKECPQLLQKQTEFGTAPTEEEMEDEDQWLREGAEKLERILEQRAQEMEHLSKSQQTAAPEARSEGDNDGVATAQSVIEEMNSFVNRMSSYEGVENESWEQGDNEETNDDGIKEEAPQAAEEGERIENGELASIRKHLQGIYSKVDTSKLKQNETGDDSQWLEDSCQSDATLKYFQWRDLSEATDPTNYMAYMHETMDAELEGSTMKKSFSTVNNGAFTEDSNVNYNLVKNMAHSVGNQSGLAGPASNVLKNMGVDPPPDWLAGQVDDDGDAEESPDGGEDTNHPDGDEGSEDLPVYLKEKLEVLD